VIVVKKPANPFFGSLWIHTNNACISNADDVNKFGTTSHEAVLTCGNEGGEGVLGVHPQGTVQSSTGALFGFDPTLPHAEGQRVVHLRSLKAQ
jgi:hypothetical protein